MQMKTIQFMPQESKTPFIPEDTAEDCAARAGIYRLLAGAFAEEPGREFLAALRQGPALAALSEMGLKFGPDFTDSPLDQLTEDLACEYATLFASPGGCPPVESARRTGRMQQEPCFEVRADYRRLGFLVQGGRFASFDDHLGAELEFVAALLGRAEAAARTGDETAFRRLDKEIKRFWSLHLGRWTRGYARLVARATEHSFYREMARLLESFAEDEITRMGLKVDDEDGRKIEPQAQETEGLQCGGAREVAAPQPGSELPASLLAG